MAVNVHGCIKQLEIKWWLNELMNYTEPRTWEETHICQEKNVCKDIKNHMKKTVYVRKKKGDKFKRGSTSSLI